MGMAYLIYFVVHAEANDERDPYQSHTSFSGPLPLSLSTTIIMPVSEFSLRLQRGQLRIYPSPLSQVEEIIRYHRWLCPTHAICHLHGDLAGELD
jgi:hypothetical protein